MRNRCRARRSDSRGRWSNVVMGVLGGVFWLILLFLILANYKGASSLAKNAGGIWVQSIKTLQGR